MCIEVTARCKKTGTETRRRRDRRKTIVRRRVLRARVLTRHKKPTPPRRRRRESPFFACEPQTRRQQQRRRVEGVPSTPPPPQPSRLPHGCVCVSPACTGTPFFRGLTRRRWRNVAGDHAGHTERRRPSACDRSFANRALFFTCECVFVRNAARVSLLFSCVVCACVFFVTFSYRISSFFFAL